MKTILIREIERRLIPRSPRACHGGSSYLAFAIVISGGVLFTPKVFSESKIGETMDGVKLTAYTPNTKTCKADKEHGGPDQTAYTNLKPSQYGLPNKGEKDPKFIMVAATRKCTGVSDKLSRLEGVNCTRKGGKVGVTSHLLGCFFKIDAKGMEGKVFYAGDTYGRNENSRKIDIAHTCDAYREKMGFDKNDRKIKGKKVENNPTGKITILSCGHTAKRGDDLIAMADVQNRNFKHDTPTAVAANRPVATPSRLSTYVTAARYTATYIARSVGYSIGLK